LDVYMDSYIISNFAEHQKLIALVCLILAAKSEDVDELIPSIKDLLYIADMQNDLGVDLRFREELDPDVATEAYKSFALMYCNLEYLVFESLGFNTIRPTVISFMNVFKNLVVTQMDLQVINDSKIVKQTNLADMYESAEVLLKQFLDFVMLDTDFFNILPSLLAASIIGITRKLLNIADYWNADLNLLTKFSSEEVTPLMNILSEKRTKIEEENETSEGCSMSDSGFFSLRNDSAEMKHQNKKRKIEDRPAIIFGIL
jgi:Cyclin, C-terminal domain/Cyclin, N-terminal domain